jgi:PIN domain nuclease of toxin-antitoxin system
MRVLLDTHTFLWFIAGSPMLSQRAKTCIEDAAFDSYQIERLW